MGSDQIEQSFIQPSAASLLLITAMQFETDNAYFTKTRCLSSPWGLNGKVLSSVEISKGLVSVFVVPKSSLHFSHYSCSVWQFANAPVYAEKLIIIYIITLTNELKYPNTTVLWKSYDIGLNFQTKSSIPKKREWRDISRIQHKMTCIVWMTNK